MKAIILAAGKGTRMRPLTNQIPKPLIPICNLPTLIFVIEKILESGINKIGLVISPNSKETFNQFIRNYNLEKNINIIIQEKPLGVAHAVKTAKDFIKNDDFLLYLGDNLIKENLKIFKDKFKDISSDALLILKEINDPKMFGVAQLNDNNEIVGIEEKPNNPKSNLAVTGIYFFKNKILNEIDKISFSERGELEITDLIEIYLSQNKLALQRLDETIVWHDTGNADALLEAAQKVKNYEKENKIKMGSYEIAAYEKGFIDKNQLLNIAQKFSKSDYGQYIKNVYLGGEN